MFNEEELIEILAESYAEENGYDDILTENFIDDITKEYESLKKRNPGLAGAVKGFVYSAVGPAGGLVYGFNKKHNMRVGKEKPEKHIVLKKTLKGLGYTALASIITPFGAAAVSSLRTSYKADIEQARKEKRLKESVNELMEDYGIYEDEYGELIIEDQLIEYVMESYNLYEEDAIDLIIESCEDEIEDLLESVELLIEDYNLEEDEAMELVLESYEDIILDEDDSKWQKAKKLSNEFADGTRIGANAATVGTAAAVGLGVAAMGARQAGRDIKRAYKSHKNIRHIRKTGKPLKEKKGRKFKRLFEEVDKLDKVARGAGVALGAYGVLKGSKALYKHAKAGAKVKMIRHDEKQELKAKQRQAEEIIKYRKNKFRGKRRRK